MKTHKDVFLILALELLCEHGGISNVVISVTSSIYPLLDLQVTTYLTGCKRMNVTVSHYGRSCYYKRTPPNKREEFEGKKDEGGLKGVVSFSVVYGD